MGWFITSNKRNRMSRLGRWAAATTLMAIALPGLAEAPETQAPAEAASLGPLAPFLLYGEEADSPWIGETDGNGYRLINADDPDAITYFFLGTAPESNGKRTLEVKTVLLQGDGKAGLLYGFRDNPKEYYLLVVNAEGLVQVFHRPPEGGLIEAMSANLERDDGQAAGPVVVTLRIVEDGDTAQVVVNDAKIGTLQGPTVGNGDIGIGAAGRLDALFLDFKLTTAGD